MRLLEAANAIEENRKMLSQAKRTLAAILNVRVQDLDNDVAKQFNSGINNLSKMLINLYEGKYDVPFVEYDDNNPFFNGSIQLKKGFSVESEVSRVIGMLNTIEADIQAFNSKDHPDRKNIIDHATMKRVELSSKYFGSQRFSLSAVRKTINAIKEMYLEKPE